MAKRSLPIWQMMVEAAGSFGGVRKSSTFFSVWFISFLRPHGSLLPGRISLTVFPAGVRTRLYLRLAPSRSGAPSARLPRWIGRAWRRAWAGGVVQPNRQNTKVATRAGFSNDVEVFVEDSLSALHQHFEQVLPDLHRLRDSAQRRATVGLA